MAAREHSCTRRDLLAGAVVAPSAVTLAGPAASAPATAVATEGIRRWVVALSGVTGAEAAMADFARETRGKARSFEEQDTFDEQFSDLLVAFNQALRRLMRVPAPDVPALGLKIVLAVDEDVASLSGGEACMKQLKEDARRLCG